jgi:site-specific recombinase XerD
MTLKGIFVKTNNKQSKKTYIPQAIFDNSEFLKSSALPYHVQKKFTEDYQQARLFLLSYQHNKSTFESFRREVERFAQYCWFVISKPMQAMRRTDIESYLTFCQKPPTVWISNKQAHRFVLKEGLREPNKNWRPFVVKVSKSDFSQGKKPKRNQYRLSEKSFREIFTILNRYYTFLIQEEMSEVNPIIQIKQKNRFFRSQQSKTKVRRISNFQWQAVIEAAEAMAKRDTRYERTLFIMSALYSMYLRISELASSDRWTPTMDDFSKDHDNHWWFVTVGKGNKERRIAVSQTMLDALKRWRKYLNLSPALPLANDNSPLVPKQKGQGAMSSTSSISKIVQACFDEAIKILNEKGFENDAQELSQATVHWLRHTGISEDVKTRPREHVRDDAGHASSNTTDKYIDITLHERHASARKKSIKRIEKPEKK